MRGFKTFADKTEMVFHPGVSAIVGPNGVGKSNVTDGILWALGEQSPKTLRTENLQDVIFVGSERRRQLNMAEVSLTLDNSDGALPTDYSEVVISRRVFRDGNAEYLINNSTCRLKDVRELLLDTGVGPKAYSVVGQGEIDAILSIRGEDRRELLEEVAGVRKYRVRRSEAERKLDATQVNLTRVADIIHELSSQRAPLEQQAHRARAYKELDEKLQKLELYLLGADYRRHNDKRGQLANEVAVARADLQVTRNMITEVDTEYQKLAALVLRLESELEKVRLEALRLQREAAEERERRAVNQERQRSLSGRREVLQENLVDHRQRQQSLAEQSQALAEELKALRDRLATEEQQLKAQIAEYEAKRLAAEQHRQQAARLDEQRVKTLQEIARLENEAAALASLQADLQERIGRLESQYEQLEARLRTIEAQVEAGEERSAQLRRAVEEAVRGQAAAEAEVKYIQAVIRDQNVKRGLLSDAVSRLESRQKVLDELRNSYEGYSEGTRNVMAAVTAGRLAGVRGVLGEALDVPQKLEVAVEAALDDKLQWILVNTQDDALRAIEYLRAEGLGRAAFYPLSSTGRQVPEAISTSGLRGGVLGIASKLIKVNRDAGAAVEALLSRIIVCSDLPSALEAYHRFTGRYTVVTLAGEVLEAEGVVRGGALEGGAGQGFSRQRELDALEGRIATLKDCLTRMLRVDEALEGEHGRARLAAEEAVETANGLRGDVRQSDADSKHLQDQRRAGMEAREETDVEIGKLRERLQRDTSRQQETEEHCGTLRQQLEQLQAQIDEARAQAGTGAEREALRQGLTQREVLVAELREKVTASSAVCQRAADDLRQATANRQAAENEMTHITGELARLESELASRRGHRGRPEARRRPRDRGRGEGRGSRPPARQDRRGRLQAPRVDARPGSPDRALARRRPLAGARGSQPPGHRRTPQRPLPAHHRAGAGGQARGDDGEPGAARGRPVPLRDAQPRPGQPRLDRGVRASQGPRGLPHRPAGRPAQGPRGPARGHPRVGRGCPGSLHGDLREGRRRVRHDLQAALPGRHDGAMPEQPRRPAQLRLSTSSSRPPASASRTCCCSPAGSGR